MKFHPAAVHNLEAAIEKLRDAQMEVIGDVEYGAINDIINEIQTLIEEA